MYRVLIVDDERLIREGLATLIDWAALGFEIAALAADGTQALEIVARQDIDLILADIRMPRLGGLELLEALRTQGHQARFLILSGFAEFSYAQRAAAGRIDGYLLKPVDEDELRARLGDVKRDLDSQRLTVHSLLGGHPVPAPHLDWGRWQVLLVLPLGAGGVAADLAPAAVASLRQTARTKGWGEVFEQPPHLGVLLKTVYPRGYNLSALARELAHALGLAGSAFAAAIGDVVTDPAQVAHSLAQARERLQRRFFAPAGIIDHTGSPCPETPAALNPADLAARLDLAYQSANPATLESALAAFKSAVLAAGLGEHDIKNLLARSLPVSRDSPWIAVLWSQTNLDGLLKYALDHLVQQFGHAPFAGPQVAPRLLEVLQNRYAENLKLEALAQAFGYNSAYLGKLFRAQTGESFHTALDRIRIEHAQNLLRQGYKVYQVAELVGYRYVDYFHAKFKKHTGVTPSEFRN